ncbi:unnamed protein product [Spirodela intermedia]|uniref:X8 domain-containing protein n=1 Tax=Spirodela intermedia TaxID=51605 RepID=A0A7I8IWM7_SPIIN|nr:unnamed protein product [Spirodela intermedia]CAA6662387.1 unnamed protein product [Spirodela intermedia]
MGRRSHSVVLGLSIWVCLVTAGSGIGANWGTQTSHPLPADVVVRLLKDNGFQKVKLFDADSASMNALKKSGLEVMVGIPNDMLSSLASNVKNAEEWVSKNVSSYIDNGVLIRYVAVGNEPFLETYNNSFIGTTFPALQNVQSALIKAGLSSRVKSPTERPSDGDFRADIRDLIINIVKFLSDNGGVFTVNIYPFISLYLDANFPPAYAFFDGGSSVADGAITYTNVFEANHDTLVSALARNGYGTLPIIIGRSAAHRRERERQPGQRTEVQPGLHDLAALREGHCLAPRPNGHVPVQPDRRGREEHPAGELRAALGHLRLRRDAQVRAEPRTSNSGTLVKARGISYLERKWGNVSYAFNSYYQKNDQEEQACRFPGLSVTTTTDPSTSTCKFNIMIDTFGAAPPKSSLFPGKLFPASSVLLFFFYYCFFSCPSFLLALF